MDQSVSVRLLNWVEDFCMNWLCMGRAQRVAIRKNWWSPAAFQRFARGPKTGTEN